MRQSVLLLMLVAMIFLAVPGQSQPAATAPPIVLELFTSQGCSSCPPAESLLSRVGRERFKSTVIPLAYHVDYWDNGGWKDPFSSRAWSARQNEYASAIRSSQLYTPQLVVNGGAQFVGSDERHLRGVLAQSVAGAAPRVTITDLRREARQIHLTVAVDGDTAVGKRNLVVALFQNGIRNSVLHGENAGRNYTSDYVVRWESNAGTLDSASRATRRDVIVPIDPSWGSGQFGIAAFVQDAGTRAINGAASVMVP